jgi:hypothetical protein
VRLDESNPNLNFGQARLQVTSYKLVVGLG